MAFHYTEFGDEFPLEIFPSFDEANGSYLWALLSNFSAALLTIFLDLVAIIFQILIGAFKLFWPYFCFG